MTMSTVTAKGQTTLPKEVREHMKLKAGDKLMFHIQDDGVVTIRAKNLSMTELFGMFKSDKSFTIKEMKDAVGKAIIKKHGPKPR